MRLWTKSIIDAPPVDWHFQSGITPPQSHLHHDGIFADILPNPPDLNPQTEYCSATNTVILLTTNAKNLCRRKGRSQELMSFYVFFNLVDHAVVDMLALKMSLTPSPHLHCGRPKIELGAWVGGEREKMKFPFLPRHNYLFFQLNTYVLTAPCFTSQPPDWICHLLMGCCQQEKWTGACCERKVRNNDFPFLHLDEHVSFSCYFCLQSTPRNIPLPRLNPAMPPPLHHP